MWMCGNGKLRTVSQCEASWQKCGVSSDYFRFFCDTWGIIFIGETGVFWKYDEDSPGSMLIRKKFCPVQPDHKKKADRARKGRPVHRWFWKANSYFQKEEPQDSGWKNQSVPSWWHRLQWVSVSEKYCKNLFPISHHPFIVLVWQDNKKIFATDLLCREYFFTVI